MIIQRPEDHDTSGDTGKAVKDPVEIIKESHDEAVKKSCHCPIGSCLHRPDEGQPVGEKTDSPVVDNTSTVK